MTPPPVSRDPVHGGLSHSPAARRLFVGQARSARSRSVKGAGERSEPGTCISHRPPGHGTAWLQRVSEVTSVASEFDRSKPTATPVRPPCARHGERAEVPLYQEVALVGKSLDVSPSHPAYHQCGREPEKSQRLRSRGVIAVAALIALAVATAAVAPRSTTSPAQLPARVSVEDNGLRYAFDALTGRESLVDVTSDAGDRIDLIDSRPDDAERMRRLLVRDLDIESLSELVDAHRPAADELRRLGYL